MKRLGASLLCAALLVGAASCQPEATTPPVSERVSQPLAFDARLDPWLMNRGLAKQRALITYDRPPGLGEEDAVTRAGGDVLQRWDRCAWVILAQLTADHAKVLVRDDPGIRAIELDGGGSGAVLNALHQVGTRQIPTVGVGGVTYTGEGITIAVIDSGINGDHPDIADRIVGWLDLAGPNGNSPGFYDSPTDVPGHGTAVSGIALGTGAASGPESYRITTSRIFPAQEGQGILQTFPIRMQSPDYPLRVLFETRSNRNGAHIASLLDDDRDLLFDVESADNPALFLFPAETLAPLEGFNAALALTTSEEDNADTGGALFEAQIEVPFVSRDVRPITAGVAPGANLYGIKLLADDNSFNSANVVLDVLTWLYDNGQDEGIDIANMSLNFFRGGPNLAVDSAVNRLVDEQGINVVVSGRNGQRIRINVASPATAVRALAVGAINHFDAIADYSSEGSPTEDDIKPDLVAPGGSNRVGLMVLSDSNDTPCKHFAIGCGLDADAFRDDYMLWAGTSFAAPHVAGLLALMLEAAEVNGLRETMTPERLRSLLFMTTTEVRDGEVAAPGEPGRDAEPKDRTEGYGRINSVAAIEAMTLAWGEEPTQTVTLGSGHGDRRAWARRLTIPLGSEARVVATGAIGMDVDLYLYDANSPDADPVILAAATNPEEDGASEEVRVSALAEARDVVVVLKWLSGDGDVALRRWVTPLACAELLDRFGEPCEAGEGGCRTQGSLICSEDGLSLVCSALPREATDELCGNGVDDDCDDRIDEGFEALSEPCEAGAGACVASGEAICAPDGLSLICDASPREPDTDERCGDDIDNDCDGNVDEGFEALGDPCQAGIGACLTIDAFVCDSARLGLECAAEPGTPTIELCGDGIDNDCNGLTDEGFDTLGETCFAGVGACNAAGSLICSTSGLTVACDAEPLEPSSEELCANGIDDDCDGNVDEGFATLGTSCTAGVGVCMTSGEFVCAEDQLGVVCDAVSGDPEPDELCGDRRDNDCDGTVDEGFDTLGDLCQAGVGACLTTARLTCDADALALVCPAQPGAPERELCGNDKDEDCDGAVDEGFDEGEPCTAGQGVCQVTGRRACTQDRLETVCSVGALGKPTSEEDVCDNGLDDDCDGRVDEGCEPEPTPLPEVTGEDDGCGCSVSGRSDGPHPGWLVGVLFVCVSLRRKVF